MAGFFDKLLSMGQAHAQHVQALQAALQNPDMQAARDALAGYLQGLSDAGLLGFRTSLALVTNSEPNPQVQAALQWVATNLDGLRAGQFAAATPESLATTGINLQQTAARVLPWLQMAPEQRQEQLHSTMQALSKAGRKEFVGHLDSVLGQAQAQLQQQQAANNSSNNSSAWGGAIEDQMAYWQAHIRAGRPASEAARQPPASPEQQAALLALQQLAQQARQWRPAKPATRVATQTTPTAPSTAPTSADLLAALHHQLPDQAGMDPARQAALHDYLARVTHMQQAHEQRPALGPNATLAERQADLQASMAHAHAMRQELQALAELQRHVRRDAHGDQPQPASAHNSASGSRAATLLPLLGALVDSAAGLRASIHTANDENESNQLEQLHNALVTARARVQQLAALPGDPEQVNPANTQVLHFERDSLRHTVQALRLHHRRGHLMVARPIWPTGPGGAVRPDPGCVVLAGADADVHGLVALACKDRLLHISPPAAPGVDPAQAHWHALQAASLVVLDLSTADPQVYYQLGQAYALGSELLLLARSGTVLPFDVAQAVLHYSSAADLATQLPAALDTALYGVQTLGLTGLMHLSLKHCTALVAQAVGEESPNLSSNDAPTTFLLQQLTANVNSPLGFAAVLDQLLARLSNPRLVLLHPRWPARYPNASPLARRCFVVMPFSSQMASTQAMYRQLCTQLEAQGVLVVRGDGALGQDIVASIWEETARASHVLVDLTGYNPNVCLELGMADAMGRDTLLFGAAGTAEARFLAINKRRIHSYGDGDGPSRAGLLDTAAAFVQRAPTWG
jgi:hypothetical protein